MNSWRGVPAAAAWGVLGLLQGPVPAIAAVQVIVGPTPIVDGDAKGARDITVINEKLAFALAVQSAPPYGVPRGALVDLAPVTDGEVGPDRVVFADFIPDQWSAWPNTHQRVDIVERGPDRAVIRSIRDWGEVTIATVYTLVSNSDHIELQATMTNGGRAALPGLLSGWTLWPRSGFLFSVPGLQGVASAAATGLADRVVAYDEGWAIALHASYFDHVGDESMDLYRLHTLGAGESRRFEGWLQVRSSGDLAPIVAAEIARRHLAAGSLHGSVRNAEGTNIERPIVIIEKQGKPYAWVMGHDGGYRVALPEGEYVLYATAKNYSRSGGLAVKVVRGTDEAHDFRDLESAGRIEFSVTDSRDGKPVDARIVIGDVQQPIVGFLGRKTFFTELDRKGRVDIPMAPGRHVFIISSGGGFFGPSRRVTLTVESQRTNSADVVLTRLFDPAARGWYSADLHHHGDQAEAVTPPADLARSELAAGLDLLFVSDHDSTVNHRALQDIADRRAIPFIPSVEFSASWGHFNAYPLSIGQPLGVDTGVATVDEIFDAARTQGAIVIQANHPFIPYGYFTSVRAGVAPGGFNPAFDLVEINDSAPDDDAKVLHALWDFWNGGHHYYLSAGTDTHDVWKSESGHVRAFAHVDGALSGAAFATSLRAGHGYVTRGPLVFPSVMFGEELKAKPGEAFTLRFDFESVAGVKSVDLIRAGAAVARKSFSDMPQQAHADFRLRTRHSTWYALVIEDSRGGKAYTDPIWVDTISLAAPTPANDPVTRNRYSLE